MNFKRNEFLALTGMTLTNMKNYERSDRSFMPRAEADEPIMEGSVRRFTPLQVLKTVLMNQLVDDYGMNIGKAFGLIEFAGKELAALVNSGKLPNSNAASPVLLAIHFSVYPANSRRGVSIFGGYPDHVFQGLLREIREDAAEGCLSGPELILNVTDALARVRNAASEFGIQFELAYAESVAGVADADQ